MSDKEIEGEDVVMTSKNVFIVYSHQNEYVKLTIDKEDCVEAEFPKKWVKIRPPMFISEERRAILVESGKKLAALSKEKAARKAVQEKE